VDVLAHRSAVGPGDKYDLIGALQFGLLTCRLGMREHHYLLDIGCGSLRGGRLFIPYLQPGHYYGIEPNAGILAAGAREEVGEEQIARKRPVFSSDNSFTLSAFGRHFDYVLAQSIFSHASSKQVRRCLSEAAKVMTDASCFAATYRPGLVSDDAEGWVSRDRAAYRPVNVSYRPEDMAKWADEAGLVCEPLDWPHPTQKWLQFKRRPRSRSTLSRE